MHKNELQRYAEMNIYIRRLGEFSCERAICKCGKNLRRSCLICIHQDLTSLLVGSFFWVFVGFLDDFYQDLTSLLVGWFFWIILDFSGFSRWFLPRQKLEKILSNLPTPRSHFATSWMIFLDNSGFSGWFWMIFLDDFGFYLIFWMIFYRDLTSLLFAYTKISLRS